MTYKFKGAIYIETENKVEASKIFTDLQFWLNKNKTRLSGSYGEMGVMEK